jgi:carbon-monoxide dehydrogenase iron sulfur subunit
MAVALTIDRDTGRVLFDRDRCVGCAMCVMVCPHQAIVPDQRAGKAIICDQCVKRDVPACVGACATGAIEFVETEEEVEIEK